MTAEVHHDQMKYAIGQSVPRTEDPKLLKDKSATTGSIPNILTVWAVI